MKFVRIGAILFLAIVAVAALAPELWARASYETQFREAFDAPPSAQFPLGTDALGRDRFSRLLYGTRVSLLLAPAAALLSCLEALLLGALAGYFGGWVDRAIQTLGDLFLSLPWFFLLIAVRACLPLNTSPAASVTITFLLLGALGWAGPARVIRAAVRKMKHSDFLLQARAAGCRPTQVLFGALAPNLKPILLAQFWTAVPVYILTEATLGMLGLGVMEPLPSWGSLLRELEGGAVLAQPWLLVPAMLLTAVIASFQLVLPREDYSA